ncbi:hypothetical protein EHS25_004729 [Saitozyma podzolica]|uniref:Uncharacterized protein n=1 Tax=Saitozyma podzolica TaxID=1890683 RepID=A0A427Y2S4_9TREE|nr:hypothetical protein EHS25_004729 [Saitozyma podzolica]
MGQDWDGNPSSIPARMAQARRQDTTGPGQGSQTGAQLGTNLVVPGFDRMHSGLFDLPLTIKPSEIFDAVTWATDHMHLRIAVDSHIACSLDDFAIVNEWLHFRSRSDLLGHFAMIHLDDLISRQERLIPKWYRSPLPDPLVDLYEVHDRDFLCLLSLSTLLDLKQAAIKVSNSSRSPIQDSIETAAKMVDQMEKVADSGSLKFLQDAGSCVLSALGSFLHRVCWLINPAQKELVIDQ